MVWLLASMGEVYVRLGVSSAKPEGVDWKRVNIPVPGSVADISLGAQRTGWIVDNNDTVMFSVDHLEHEPHWWQVGVEKNFFCECFLNLKIVVSSNFLSSKGFD